MVAEGHKVSRKKNQIYFLAYFSFDQNELVLALKQFNIVQSQSFVIKGN